MIHIADLANIIDEATKAIGMHSMAATQLLLGTAAVESRWGHYIWQQGGPALGIWQVEPSTHTDCWTNWLDYRPDIAALVLELAPSWRRLDHPSSGIPIDHLALVESPHYCCAIARIKYRRVKEPLPLAGDWAGFERYHKQYYNTVKGKTQPGQFLAALRTIGIGTNERLI